jgi:hypothetical protein
MCALLVGLPDVVVVGVAAEIGDACSGAAGHPAATSGAIRGEPVDGVAAMRTVLA